MFDLMEGVYSKEKVVIREVKSSLQNREILTMVNLGLLKIPTLVVVRPILFFYMDTVLNKADKVSFIFLTGNFHWILNCAK